MALEIRRIILAQDEVLAALKSYRRTNPDFLPQGDIVECKVNPDVTLTAKLKMSYGKSEQIAEFPCDTATLTEILIRYCIENNVPIPRRGRKTAVHHGGHAALEIRLAGEAAIDSISDSTYSGLNEQSVQIGASRLHG